MSSVAAMEREKRIIAGAKKYKKQRDELKRKVKDTSLSNKERFDAQAKLDEKKAFRLKVRITNRCGITGDPRSYYHRYGVGRNTLRALASRRQIPGMKKASW